MPKLAINTLGVSRLELHKTSRKESVSEIIKGIGED